MSDRTSVYEFAGQMVLKMDRGRKKGRSGWRTCPIDELWNELRTHVEKGDPVDVANLAMMIWHNSNGNG